MEYMNGKVKKIPMQQPMNPTMAAIIATITSPNRINGCFKTTTILELMASIAFKFPNMINGMVRKVKNDIVMAIKDPIILIPA